MARKKKKQAKPSVALSDDGSDDLDVSMPAGSWQGSPSPSDDAAVDDIPATNGSGPNDDGSGDDNEEDDEDLDEDIFIVETIKKHMVDEDGSLKFQVKWEGWNAKKDLTWEPEENLKESATEVLDEYFTQIGGRDKIFEESEAAARGKKRGRQSTGASSVVTKRSRKNGAHPGSGTPPATSKKWSPPAGSWEDEIESIDACEDEGSGKLVVYLIWKNGQKTRHETPVIYKKCPQKMLQFYECHVKIIRDENKALADNVEG